MTRRSFLATLAAPALVPFVPTPSPVTIDISRYVVGVDWDRNDSTEVLTFVAGLKATGPFTIHGAWDPQT